MLLMQLGVLSEEGRKLVDKLYREYNEKMYYSALKMLRNDDDAQDAVAQTFLRISEHIERIGGLPKEDVAPYCSVIARNASTDILRFRKKVVSTDEVPEPKIEKYSEVERWFLQAEDQERLGWMIEKLSAEDRFFIHLRFVYEMNYREIAQIIGVSEDAAGKRGQKLVKKLRALYEKEENSGK